MTFQKSSGMVPEVLKLMGAHVVIRHGDRAPLIHLPGDKAPPLSCLVDARQFHHLPKLQNYEHVMAQAAQIEDDVTSEFSRWEFFKALEPLHLNIFVYVCVLF